MSYVLLSFDVEEFDIPLEYGQNISLDEQLDIGIKGLQALDPILQNKNVETTLFTTANFALNFKDHIRNLSTNHELASHTFYHSSYKTEDLLKSKIALEEISGTPVIGLRMPRMKKVDMKDVIEAGYKYDSSINPTWLPGKYNNLNLPRKFYKAEGIVRVPASVAPVIRLPLFWLGFKNYPYSTFLFLCKRAIAKDGYVCLYFHPWEFADISSYKLPKFIKNPDNKLLVSRLEKLIKDLGKNEFISIKRFLEIKNAL